MSINQADRERLEKLNKQRMLSTFKATVIETNEPLKAVQLCRYNRQVIIIRATDNNFYALTKGRCYKLQTLEQPLEKGWIAEELTPLVKKNLTQSQSVQQQIQEQQKQYLEIFQTALPHERTDIRLQADFDNMMDEYFKSEDFQRDNERIEALCKEWEDEKNQREKQGLLELW